MLNRYQKIITSAFLIMFFLPFAAVLFFSSCNLEESTGPNDYARIVDVDYKAVLVDEPGNGGKLVITEKLTYDIHAASKNNLFWELWRDLPEDYVDGLKVDYKVNYVKQLNDDGTETIYAESPKLYWNDSDYTSSVYGPGKWFHSEGPYNEELRNYECVLFYIEGTYREKLTFEIQYVMNNAALRYSDVSELYISMYSEETIKYLESFNGQILIPIKDMPSEGNYVAHTYGTNSHVFDFSESTTINPGYHTFSFNLDKEDLKFKPFNQYIEFSLLAFNEDKHIFTNYAPANYYSNDVYLEEALNEIDKYDKLPAKAKTNKIILLSLSIIGSIALIMYVIRRDKNIRKTYKIIEKKDPIIYYRDIPNDLDPYFAASFAFAKRRKKADIGDAYSALLLNLVRKGYIELQKEKQFEDWNSKNILLKIIYDPTSQINDEKDIETPQDNKLYNIYGKELETLSTNEQSYFNLITRYSSNGSIKMNIFENRVNGDYDNTYAFVSSIESSVSKIGVKSGYFRKANYKELNNITNRLSTIFAILGFIIIIIGNLIIYQTRLELAFGALFIAGISLLISSLLLAKVANKYTLLTDLGEAEHEKWRALYDFLNNETLMKEKTIIELPLWEKYLVYATAFGISEKVIKALELRCPDIAESPVLGNGYYRSRSFRISSHTFRSSVHRSSAHHGGHGGGGYGGGGRGGGGGGGGH